MKEIHSKMLHKHLKRLEAPSEDEHGKRECTPELVEHDSVRDSEGMSLFEIILHFLPRFMDA